MPCRDAIPRKEGSVMQMFDFFCCSSQQAVANTSSRWWNEMPWCHLQNGKFSSHYVPWCVIHGTDIHHKRDIILTSHRRRDLSNQPYLEIANLRITGPLCGESIADSWIPIINDQQCGNVFMPWSHHADVEEMVVFVCKILVIFIFVSYSRRSLWEQTICKKKNRTGVSMPGQFTFAKIS